MWPLATHAQQPAKIPLLGFLLYSSLTSDPNAASLLHALRDIGYIEGKNVRHEYRYAEGKAERLPDLGKL